MITLAQNIFDVLARRLPAQLYEPIYIAGILGLVTIGFIGGKKEKSSLLVILSAIAFIIFWRVLLYSRISSRRYFEILLIPFFIFSAHGCNCLTVLGKSFLKEKLHKNVFKISFSVLFLILLAFEIGKMQRNDFYTYTKLQCYERYAKNDNEINPVYLFIEDAHEINRIKYYSAIRPQNISSFSKGESDPFSFSKRIPNLLYYKNTLLLYENSSKQQSNDTVISINGLSRPKQICRVFTSQKKKRFIAGYLYSPVSGNTPAVDPILVRGTKEYVISPNDFSHNATLTYNGLNPVISGHKSVIFAKEYIPVPDENALHLNIDIKNIGDSSPRLYIGYAFYDKNKQLLGANFYPEGSENTIMTVLSAKKEDSYLVVDTCPQWKKKRQIAINAMEDWSDIPNKNVLSGVVSDVELISERNAKIFLSKPLGKDIPPGTRVRLQGPSGAYIYQFNKHISPGRQIHFSSSIAKYNSYLYYSPAAISRGVYYVRPLILSYSEDKSTNSIEIINWRLTY